MPVFIAKLAALATLPAACCRQPHYAIHNTVPYVCKSKLKCNKTQTSARRRVRAVKGSKFNNRIVHEGCQSSMLGKHMECEQTVWATVLTARGQIKLQLPERAKRNRKLINLVPVCMTENHCLLSGAAYKMNKLLHDLLSIQKHN